MANDRNLARCAAAVGIAHTDWGGDHARTKRGEKPNGAVGYGALAFKAALADAGLCAPTSTG